MDRSISDTDIIIEDNQTNDLTVIQSELPANLRELTIFIREKTTILNFYKTALKSGQVPVEKFNDLLLQGQELGDRILDAKVELGKAIKNAPSAQGKRTDLENEDNFASVGNEVKSKKEAYLKLSLNKTQSDHYQLLASYPETVEKVKKQARENNEIPTEYAVRKKIDELIELAKKRPKVHSEILFGTSKDDEEQKKAYQKTMEEIELAKNDVNNWEAVKLNPPTIMPMDCISFIDWCPPYDLLITAPSYQKNIDLIVNSPNEWVNQWIYAGLSVTVKTTHLLRK